MAQFFGEYLVKQGAITESELIGALVEQVKSTPSVFEVVHAQSLMETEDILTVLKFQHDNDKEFVSSSKELGFWSQEIREKVGKEISKVRSPLGKVLLNGGKLEVSQLISHLDEFLGDRIEEVEQETKAAKELEQPADDTASLSPEESATATLAAVPKTDVTDGGLSAAEYMSCLTEAKYIELEALILSIEPLKESVSADVLRIMGPFRSLYELLETSGLDQSLNQFKNILDVLDKFQAQKVAYEEGLYWEFKAVTKGALDILWEIHELVGTGKSEADFMTTEGRGAALVDLTKDWSELKAKLDACSPA